jgi:hypothetical protein
MAKQAAHSRYQNPWKKFRWSMQEMVVGYPNSSQFLPSPSHLSPSCSSFRPSCLLRSESSGHLAEWNCQHHYVFGD